MSNGETVNSITFRHLTELSAAVKQNEANPRVLTWNGVQAILNLKKKMSDDLV